MTICRSSARERHVFTSNGNIADLQIIPQTEEQLNGFVLEYNGEYANSKLLCKSLIHMLMTYVYIHDIWHFFHATFFVFI